MRRFLAAPLLLLLLLLAAVPAIAAAPDPLTPPRPLLSQPYFGGRTPLYDNPDYPPWHYTFEGEGLSATPRGEFYLIMNQLQTMKAWLLKLSIRSVEYAFSQDWYRPFATRSGEAMTALGAFFWERDGAPWVVGALSLAGLWALLLYLKGRTGAVWASLGGTALILAATAIVLNQGPASVQAGLTVARDASRQVYSLLDKVSGLPPEADGLLVRAGDHAWKVLVYEPWLQGAFGTAEGNAYFRRSQDGLDGGRVLALTQDRRLQDNDIRLVCLITEANQLRYCPWWRSEYLAPRMAISLYTSLAALLFGGALLALSGGIMLAQLLLAVLLALAPIWLLVGLWAPGRGLLLLRDLLMKGFGALVSQAVLAASLGLLLLLVLPVQAGFGSQGWVIQSALLAGFGLLAFRYRYAWLAPLAPAAAARYRSEAAGLWDRLRERVAGLRRPEGALAVAAGPGSGLDIRSLPAFSSLPAPPPEAQRALVEVQRVLEQAPGAQASRPGPSPRETVQGQMRLLREQLTLREELHRRSEVERIQQAARGEFEEPAPRPKVGNGEAGVRPSEPHAPVRAPRGGDSRTSDVTRLPTQRPRS